MRGRCASRIAATDRERELWQDRVISAKYEVKGRGLPDIEARGISRDYVAARRRRPWPEPDLERNATLGTCVRVGAVEGALISIRSDLELALPVLVAQRNRPI